MLFKGDFNKGLFLIAEIGANHDGDPKKAHQLIDCMADAGADAVKFQTYTPEILLADQDRLVEWGSPHKRHKETAGEMFRRVALPREAHAELFAHARERGVEPFSTVFDPKDIEFLISLGQKLFKISSGDVNYKKLLEEVAGIGLPVIISGGKCTLEELQRAMDILSRSSAPLSLMHCLATYPAPIDEVNLRVLEDYKSRYPKVTLGFSDHTQGITCVLGAIALGARVIEKHVTYDKKAFGPDHWFSADPEEFSSLCRESRNLFEALGSKEKRVAPSEEKGVKYTRRSIIAKRDLPKGHVLSENDFQYLRPGYGIDPFDIEKIIGKSCRNLIKKNTPITWEMIQ